MDKSDRLPIIYPGACFATSLRTSHVQRYIVASSSIGHGQTAVESRKPETSGKMHEVIKKKLKVYKRFSRASRVIAVFYKYTVMEVLET
jgi:hypothetical protein